MSIADDSNDTMLFDMQYRNIDFQSLNRLPTEVVEIVIYLLCLCIGGPLNLICFGRSFRLYVNGRKQRNQILLLRLHLNIADLLTIFIYTPSQIIWMTTFQWYGCDTLCRICKFFHTFNFYLNSFVIAVIAVDRAQGAYRINNIEASKLAFRWVKCMLATSYIAAIIFSVPQIFIFRVYQPNENIEFRQCTPIWTIYAYKYDIQMRLTKTDQEKNLLTANFYQVLRLEKMYNITHLLLVFWIPTTIIAFSYMFVICKFNSMKRQNRHANRPLYNNYIISRISRNKQYGNLSTDSGMVMTAVTSTGAHDISAGNDCSTATLEKAATIGPLALQTLSKASKIAKRQAALTLIAYLALWSPYNMLAMMNTLTMPSENGEVIMDTLNFLNALIVVNPVVNPIIYGLF
ncbi:7 transmembrane receptor (rhodopsin family) protein [Acanthocheilonema viteae]